MTVPLKSLGRKSCRIGPAPISRPEVVGGDQTSHLVFLWPPYVIGQAIYIFMLRFLLLLFLFPRLISADGEWMSTILPHMVWP